MWRGDGRVARCLAIAALESCRCTEGGGGAPTGVVPGPVTATRNVQEKTMQSYVAEYASATRSSRLEGQGLLVVPCWKGKGCWSSQPGRAWLQPVTLGASPPNPRRTAADGAPTPSALQSHARCCAIAG